MSFWRKPENKDEPMEACLQSVACRSSEVCRSGAKESRITNNHKKTLCHSGVGQNPGAKKYIKNYRNKYITKSYIL